jgi:hypothetical protein
MTAEERARIQGEARRYVREQAPTPPVAILEQVARIIANVRWSPESVGDPTPHVERSGQWEAA